MQNIQFTTIDHEFVVGDTIRAIIRKHNNFVGDPNVLDILYQKYLQINGDHVPRPGYVAKIPVINVNKNRRR